jgi:peptidoglycan-N-acetylglucosamine deacetylase
MGRTCIAASTHHLSTKLCVRPMVDSGQIALGNHTWSHPDITRLSQNADFLRNTYGLDGTPHFRRPSGRHTAADKVAANLA